MNILRVLVIGSLIFLGVRSNNAFYANQHRFDGLMLVCCGMLLGLNGFRDTAYDYKQAQSENNTTKILSALRRMTLSGVLIIISIGFLIYIVYRWNNLK